MISTEVLEQELKPEAIEMPISKEELLDMVDKGIRPDWLPQQSFKELRARIQKERKNKLKGTLVHTSAIHTEGKKTVGITYIKPLDKE